MFWLVCLWLLVCNAKIVTYNLAVKQVFLVFGFLVFWFFNFRFVLIVWQCSRESEKCWEFVLF